MIKQFKEKGLKGGREYRLVQEGREMKGSQMMGDHGKREGLKL